MSGLTDHQRKAGRTKTEKKTKASRRTVAMAREGKATLRELRARYVAALERVLDCFPNQMTPGPYNIRQEVIYLIESALELREELGGKR